MTDFSQQSVLPAFPSTNQKGDVYLPLPDKSPDGDVVGHAVQIINAEPVALYEFWSDLKRMPLWQEHVVSVTPLGDGLSHWVMGNPEKADDKKIEFDSKITEAVPGKKIAWESVTEGVELAGLVTFETASNGRGTLVTLMHSFKVPGGGLGNALAGVAKRSPRQTVIEDLRHFKQMAETGEIPSIAGQPHGPRGLSGSVKEWMYGETNPTPKGASAA